MSRRFVLLAAVLLLLGALVAELWYVAAPPDPVPTDARPVVLDAVAGNAAVRAAATSTAEILSYGFEDFDRRLEEVSGRMTPEFAEEFSRRAEAGEVAILAERATQEVRVVESSVVRASEDEVQALLFLDRYLAKAGQPTSVRPYRALVTVVRSGGVWLVSDIQTL